MRGNAAHVARLIDKAPRFPLYEIEDFILVDLGSIPLLANAPMQRAFSVPGAAPPVDGPAAAVSENEMSSPIAWALRPAQQSGQGLREIFAGMLSERAEAPVGSWSSVGAA
jgi:hypothetical protein